VPIIWINFLLELGYGLDPSLSLPDAVTILVKVVLNLQVP